MLKGPVSFSDYMWSQSKQDNGLVSASIGLLWELSESSLVSETLNYGCAAILKAPPSLSLGPCFHAWSPTPRHPRAFRGRSQASRVLGLLMTLTFPHFAK